MVKDVKMPKPQFNITHNLASTLTHQHIPSPIIKCICCASDMQHSINYKDMSMTSRPTIYVDASLKKIQQQYPYLGIGMFCPQTELLVAAYITSQDNQHNTLTINTGELIAIKEAIAYIS